MTQDELFDFINLQSKFQKRCEEICNLLTPLSYSYNHLSEFYIDDNNVWGEGDEYYGNNGCEHHSNKFPLKFLCASNEDINCYVKKELSLRAHHEQVEKSRLKKITELWQEKRDRKEYERLKKKYEGSE